MTQQHSSRNETQDPEIKLAFSVKTDGEFWYLHGEQVVPGLNLTGPDLGKVLADVLPAWRALHRIAPQQVPEAPRTSLHSESGERESIGDWDMMARELCHRLGAQDGEHMVDMLWKAVDDALRYRFLKSRLTVPGAVHQFVRLNNLPPNTDLRDVDAAIDAAMAPHRHGVAKGEQE